MEIYVYRGAESLGTFTLKETTRYLSEGRLVDTDMVWYAGLDDWRQLGEVRSQLTSLEPPAEYDGTQAEAQIDEMIEKNPKLIQKK